MYVYIYISYIYIHIYIYISYIYIYIIYTIYIYTHIHFMTHKKTMPAPSDNALWFCLWFPDFTMEKNPEKFEVVQATTRFSFSSKVHLKCPCRTSRNQKWERDDLVIYRIIYLYIYIWSFFWIHSSKLVINTTNKNVNISPAWQPNSERFQQGSTTVLVFRGVHFRVTSPLPQRLKPNRFAVGNYTLW